MSFLCTEQVSLYRTVTVPRIWLHTIPMYNSIKLTNIHRIIFTFPSTVIHHFKDGQNSESSLIVSSFLNHFTMLSSILALSVDPPTSFTRYMNKLNQQWTLTASLWGEGIVKTETVNLWNLLYKNIGLDLSKISMPVTLKEPLSTLQRLCEPNLPNQIHLTKFT